MAGAKRYYYGDKPKTFPPYLSESLLPPFFLLFLPLHHNTKFHNMLFTMAAATPPRPQYYTQREPSAYTFNEYH